MAVCPNGSSAIPGGPAYVHVDPAWLEALFPVALLWLKPFLPYMPPVDIDVSVLCSADPPGWPTLDAQDLINLIKPTKAGLAVTAGFKLSQLAHQLLWYRMCQCNAPDSTPALPTAPSQPTGAPSINPPAVVAPPVADNCGDFTNSVATYNPNNSLSRGAWSLTSIPATSARFRVTTALVTAPGPRLAIQLQLLNERVSPAATLMTYDATLVPGATLDWTVPIPPSTSTIWYTVHADATLGQSSESAHLELYCGGQLPGPVVNCGTDPRLLGLLEQIYGLLTSVQRNYAPFAYIRGADHSGISGTGSFSVDRLIGLDVAVTTVPAEKQQLLGNPPYIKDLGWLSVSEADGMIQERRVAQQDFTWFPQLAPIATQVNYALQPGVTVTITELLPEP